MKLGTMKTMDVHHHQLGTQAGPAPDAERAACCLENVLPMVLGGQTLKDLLCLEAALQGNQDAKQEGLSVVQGALVRCKLAGRYCWFQVHAASQVDGTWWLVVGQVDQRRTIKSEFVSLMPNNKLEAGAQAELAELATRWHNMLSSRRQVARIQWMVEGGTDQLSKILKREGIPPGTGSFPVPAPALESLMTTLRNPKGPASQFPLVQPAVAVPSATAAGARQGVASPAPAPLAAAPATAQQQQQQFCTVPMAPAALAKPGVTAARSQSAPLGPAAAAFVSGPALPLVRPGLVAPPDPRIMRRGASMPVGPTAQPAIPGVAAAAPAPFGGAPLAAPVAALMGPEQAIRPEAAPLPAAAVPDVQMRIAALEPALAQAAPAAPAAAVEQQQQQQQQSWAAAPAAEPLQAAVGSGAPMQPQERSSSAVPPQQAPLDQAAAALCASASTLPLSLLHWSGSVGTRPSTSSARLAALEGSAELAGPSAALPSHPLGAAAAGPVGNSGGVHSSVAGPAGIMTAAGAAAVPNSAPAAGSAAGPAAGPAAAAVAMEPVPKAATAAVLPAVASPVPAPAGVGPSSTPGTNEALLDSAALHATAEADPLAFLAELKREVADLMGSMGLDADGNPLQANAATAALGGGAPGGRESAPVSGTAVASAATQPSSCGQSAVPAAVEAAAAAPGRGAQEGSSVPAGAEAAVRAQAEGPLAGLLTAGIKHSRWDVGPNQQQQGSPGASQKLEPVGTPTAGIKRSRWDAVPAVGASFLGLHAKQARTDDLAEQGQRAGGAGAGSSNIAEPAAVAVWHRERGSGAAAVASPTVGSWQSRGRTADRECQNSRSPSRQRSGSRQWHSGSRRQQSRSPSSWQRGSRHRQHSRGRSRGRRPYSSSRSSGRRHRSSSRSRSRSGARRYRSRSSSRHGRSRSRSREQLEYVGTLSSRVLRAIYNLCEHSHGILPLWAFDRTVVVKMEDLFGRSEGQKLDFLGLLRNALPRYTHLANPAAWVMHHLTCQRWEPGGGLGALPQRAQDAIVDLCEREGRNLPLSSFDESIITRLQGKLRTERQMLGFVHHVAAEVRPGLRHPASWMMSLLAGYRI